MKLQKLTALAFFLILSNVTMAMAMALENIPLTSSSGWLEVKYDNLPANKIHFDSQAASHKTLTMDIDRSASPLIFPFSQERSIQQIVVTAKVHGHLKISDKKIQGSKGADDFVFRLGFVRPGKKTLSLWQKPFASKWVTQLFNLAPKGSGIDSILFLSVPSTSQLTGKKRTHPASDLIQEIFLKPVSKNGSINIHYTFPKPIPTLALWLSSDGDDTKSKYQIQISKITINPHLKKKFHPTSKNKNP